LHQYYTFYVKVTADGGSKTFFGPYELNVGCFAASVSYSDHPNFISSINMLVGDITLGAYTLMQPSATRAWCVIQSNEIIKADESSWTGPAKL